MCNRGVLKQQVGNADWGQHVSDILRAGIQRPKKGHDAGDHPPITPMKAASESELGHEAWRLYDYITRHFIATVSVSICCLLFFSLPVFSLLRIIYNFICRRSCRMWKKKEKTMHYNNLRQHKLLCLLYTSDAADE